MNCDLAQYVAESFPGFKGSWKAFSLKSVKVLGSEVKPDSNLLIVSVVVLESKVGIYRGGGAREL